LNESIVVFSYWTISILSDEKLRQRKGEINKHLMITDAFAETTKHKKNNTRESLTVPEGNDFFFFWITVTSKKKTRPND